MYSDRGDTPQRVPGFPIRTSADRSPVDGSPQLFAVTHVLHRFLAPRHPPLALCSLEEQRCSCLLCSSQRAARSLHQPRGNVPMRPPGRSTSRERELPAAEPEELVPGAERVTPCGADSLKTEEKTRSADRFERRTDPATLDDVSTDPPVHQLGTGSNRAGRMPANDLNVCSLERR